MSPATSNNVKFERRFEQAFEPSSLHDVFKTHPAFNAVFEDERMGGFGRFEASWGIRNACYCVLRSKSCRYLAAMTAIGGEPATAAQQHLPTGSSVDRRFPCPQPALQLKARLP